MKNIAIFASGQGSNALNIIRHFRTSSKVRVSLVISNKGNAPVLLKAALENIPVMILDKKEYFAAPELVEFLQREKIDLIVLAGFLWLVPSGIIAAFPNKIVNIHPALLPKFGGKGMYGMNIHRAVIAAGEKESGVSIHFVNGQFDQGEIIFQATCPVAIDETTESLSLKIKSLEQAHYPNVIEKLLL